MPPSGQQNYGPHFEGKDHQDHQPFFQYSQCTGKRKALLVRPLCSGSFLYMLGLKLAYLLQQIGINYVGQDGELRGCINDVENLKEFIISTY